MIARKYTLSFGCMGQYLDNFTRERFFAKEKHLRNNLIRNDAIECYLASGHNQEGTRKDT